METGTFRFTLSLLDNALGKVYAGDIISFYNVTDYKLTQPSRAQMGSNRLFMAALRSSDSYPFSLPTNIFMTKSSLSEGTKTVSFPPLIVSNANYNRTMKKETLFPQVADDGTLLPLDDMDSEQFFALPTSAEIKEALYSAGGRDTVLTPYLPYFANCQYFGSYVFLPSVVETHPQCTRVPERLVKPILPMKFGMKSTSDECNEVVLSCAYSLLNTATQRTPLTQRRLNGTRRRRARRYSSSTRSLSRLRTTRR